MGKVFAYETRADMLLMDGNNHMRNSGYLDVATASRYRYLQDSGFGQARLAGYGIGPVIRWERIEYRKEVRHGEPLRIELRCSGASPKVSRFRFSNRIICGDRLAAVVESEAGWLDLQERKLVLPPDEMRSIVLDLERTDDFAELRESVLLK